MCNKVFMRTEVLKALVICHEHIHQTLKFSTTWQSLNQYSGMNRHIHDRTSKNKNNHKSSVGKQTSCSCWSIHFNTRGLPALSFGNLHLKLYVETEAFVKWLIFLFCPSSSALWKSTTGQTLQLTAHTVNASCWRTQTCTNTCRRISVNTEEQTTLIKACLLVKAVLQNWVAINALKTVLF